MTVIYDTNEGSIELEIGDITIDPNTNELVVRVCNKFEEGN